MFTLIPDISIEGAAGEYRRVTREVTVLGIHGVHIRPAAELVGIARKFESAIHLLVEGRPFGARSILEVLSANLGYGKRVTLSAEGTDAEKAVIALEEFFDRLGGDPSEGEQPGPRREQRPSGTLRSKPLRQTA